MKTDTAFAQKGTRIGSAGGFFNQLMSHNCSVPVVGQGATELFYSDRSAYEVLSVDEKKKAAVLQKYAPKRIDNNGMSDSQEYEYKDFEGEPFTIYYKWGSWKSKGRMVTFTKEAREKYGDFGKELHEAYQTAGGAYEGAFIDSVIPGLTEEHTEWHTRNFIFGVKREYYDFSF
jgi:hypothetical protein